MIEWHSRHPRFRPEMLGYLAGFLDSDDPRPAQQQLDAAYPFGSGWRPGKFQLAPINDALLYPGDPPQLALAETMVHHERVVLYPHSLVAIIRPDGTFVVQRMD